MIANAAGHLPRVLGNAAMLAVCRIGADLAFLGFYVALSRRYGADGLGAYAFAMAASSLISGIPQYGLAKFLIRHGSASQTSYQTAWRGVRRLSIRATLGTATLIVAIAWVMPVEARAAMILVGTGQLCYAQAEIFRATFAVHERLGRIAYAELIYKGALLALGLPLVLSGAALSVTLVAFPLAGAGYLALVVFAARVNLPRDVGDDTPVKPLIRQALPFLTAALLEAPIYRQHMVLLAVLAGVAASGIYASAWKLVEAGLLCFGFVNAALLPTLTRLHVTDRDQHRTVLGRIALLVAVVAASGAAVAAVLAPWLMNLLYGPEFSAAVPVLQILCVVLLVTGVRQLLVTALNAAGRAWQWAWSQGVSLGAGALAGVTLIPIFGATGAACALLAGELIGCSVALYLYRSTRESLCATEATGN